MVVLTILGVVAAIALALYVYLTWHFDYWKKRGVSGPTPKPYVGTFPLTALRKSGFNMITECDMIFKKYYKKHRFVGVFEHRTPKLFLLDPALVKDVEVKYFQNFKDNLFTDFVDEKTDPLFMESPFIETDYWKERRAEVAGGLSMSRVKAMYPIIWHNCEKFVEFINESVDSGKAVFNAKELTNRYAAEVVFDLAYGLKANCYRDDSVFLKNTNAFYSSQSSWTAVHTIINSVFNLHKIWPIQILPKDISDWFISTLKYAEDLRSKSEYKRDDLLNYLLDLKAKKNRTDVNLAAHIFTFFLDGVETSSYVLSNALAELSKSPHYQEKLRAEINENDITNIDVLNQMPYLDNVFDEATRVSPFPFTMWKKCTKPIEFTDYDGTTVMIEKGTSLFLPVYSLHYLPEYFDEPKSFNPERFADAGEAKRFKDAGVFMPFGNGPRQCPGMKFAIIQIKAALYAIIKNFELSPKEESGQASKVSAQMFFSDVSTLIEFKKIQSK